MSSWFDRLLQDLQRRQLEQDARREGRPLPPREPGMRGRRSRGNGAPPFGGPTIGGSGYGSFRRWVVLGGLGIAALLALGLLGGLVNLATDLMWYGALGRRDVLTTRLFAQVGLFMAGFAVFAIVAVLSIIAARRIAPQVPVRRIGGLELPDASRAITLALAAVALLLALGSGGAWAANWETILLFINGGSWGRADPTLGRDIGFYIFDLPFLSFFQGWAMSSLIAIGVLTLGAYAAGAMRWQFRLSAPVRAHLSIIGALILVTIAAGYQLDIANLAYSTRGIRGTIQAATYTDMNAQLPAYVILTFVALVSAALLVLNIWFRTLWLLVLGGVGWFVLSILVGGLYPFFVQRVQVEPNELSVERPFIARHIAATRAAFDLDAVESRTFTGEQPVSRAVFDANQPTLQNIRLWDYRPLLVTFGQQQILRQYYDFRDVDIDRYQVAAKQRQIMLSARELDVEKLADAARTWTNERLVFTHGYGITAVPVDAVTPEGQPDYLVSGINREPQLPVGEPRIYFGEATDTYVVTGTRTAEFDYPLENREANAVTTWKGSTGVGIGNPITRLLFALRFGDLNLLISNQLTDSSQILFKRTISERVHELAPFLTYDADPYIVSADNRLVWIWDAYTTSS
ncbi:MAG: UPF0182 family protein, partial [Chloroflexota bacterium]